MMRGGPGLATPEADALRKVLDSKDLTKEQIQAAIKDYRDARTKKEQELKKAQEELRGVLNPRQEAQFILLRMLD
jgi:Spy/CpxP family protein refolding chaperone